MSSTTLTALYQTRQDAEAARDRLSAAGIGGDVDIHDNTDRDGEAPTGGTFGAAGSQPSLMDKIAAFFGGHDDTHTYHEGVLRGHYLLTVRVEELGRRARGRDSRRHQRRRPRHCAGELARGRLEAAGRQR